MSCCGSSSKKNKQVTADVYKNLSPIDLQKFRLAKGEITFEEYEKIKAVLQ